MKLWLFGAVAMIALVISQHGGDRAFGETLSSKMRQRSPDEQERYKRTNWVAEAKMHRLPLIFLYSDSQRYSHQSGIFISLDDPLCDRRALDYLYEHWGTINSMESKDVILLIDSTGGSYHNAFRLVAMIDELSRKFDVRFVAIVEGKCHGPALIVMVACDYVVAMSKAEPPSASSSASRQRYPVLHLNGHNYSKYEL